MKFALINPNWIFDGSIYFGCREAHLPLEFAYSEALLKSAGHDAIVIDGQLDALSLDEIAERVREYAPDYTVVTSAPSYLFWRCAPPELTCPQAVIEKVRPDAGKIVLVGPHASTTPRAALDKTGADFVILGECEEMLAKLADEPLSEQQSIGYYQGEDFVCGGVKHASNMQALPALSWRSDQLARHKHHHHRFDLEPDGWGAEMETSRGCPYACSFCAKDNFRNKYRKRPLDVVLKELDGLIAEGARYVYFIDEIFLPNRELLEAVRERDIKFGVQTRIDLWSNDLLDLLGEAGCVSIEAGVESITEEGRAELNKNCKVSTDDMTERLIHARKSVAFVQGNLIQAGTDEEAAVDAWRDRLQAAGVWANKPVPLFPYPGSPDYTKRWGLPDYNAWERAHESYLKIFDKFSDVQDARPLELSKLEKPVPPRRERMVRSQPARAMKMARAAFNPVRPAASNGEPLRVLMTCDAVGGVWTYAMDLCQALESADVEILLAVLGPPMSTEQRQQAAELEGVKIIEHHGALEWMDNPWDDVRAAGEWLERCASEFRPDLVHLNGYSHAAIHWQVPVMVVAHSCVYSWWNAVYGENPPARYGRYFEEVKKGLQAAQMVVAPTRAILNDLRRCYGVEGDSRVVYNGRNLESISPGPRANFIFSAGRVWDKAKNFRLLNRIAPELRAEVTVAGSGSETVLEPFSNLNVLGHVSPEEMNHLYKQAAVFVSAARYEPFGLCILEAALHGCPLVLPDLDSLREIWQDNALYVASEDGDGFTAAINKLLGDEVARQRLGGRACFHARQFTADLMANRYLRLYNEICGRRPESARAAGRALPGRNPDRRTASSVDKNLQATPAAYNVSRRS